MSVLIVVAAAVGLLTAYLLVGWWFMRRDLPRAWARARDEWHYDEIAREAVMTSSVLMILSWPALIPGRRVLSALNRQITQSDPVNVRAMRHRIEELERELRIGGSS